MQPIVLDTSVIVKWFSEEENSDKAAQILEAIADDKLQLIIPDVALAEIANSLRYNREFKEDEPRETIKRFLQLEPRFELIQTLVNSAMAKAHQFDLAIYDALFIVLAEELDTDLITADYKHHKKSLLRMKKRQWEKSSE